MRLWGTALLTLALGGLACGGGNGKGADGPSAAIKIPLEVYDYTLPNGMRVILDPDPTAPVVAVNVWYKVGAKDDPPKLGGIAHFVEHLMFQGTRTIDGSVFPAMHHAGATDINATTNHDRTEYHETVPRTALEWALWFESERLTTFGERLDQKGLDRERGVVKNELRQGRENVEGGAIGDILFSVMFGKDHPYGHPVIGTLDELDAVTIQDVKAFHAQHYVPSNAVLSLVGDFDRKAANEWIAKYFAPIPPKSSNAWRTPKPAALAGEHRIVVEARLPYPLLVVAYPLPDGNSPDLVPVRAIGGHIAGHVSYYLVEERKVARDVGFGVWPSMLGSMGVFSIKLAKGADPEDALRVLDKPIFESKPSEFGSFNPSYNRMKLHHVFEYESFDDRAEMYAHYDDTMRNPLFLAREIEAIHNTDRADAFAARTKYLQTKNRLVAFVNASPNAPISGRIVKE